MVRGGMLLLRPTPTKQLPGWRPYSFCIPVAERRQASPTQPQRRNYSVDGDGDGDE